MALAARTQVIAANPDAWPTFLHDAQRSGASTETLLSPANAGQLGLKWKTATNGGIAASASISGGTAFVGSWDGFEYALDAATGAVKWKQFLGQTVNNACDPPTIGITSAAAVVNNVVYVGGGDAYWYALDATTGAVLWRVFTGDNTAQGGYYNWSSPLIYNGSAYIGTASNCDNPLVQGQLLRVDLATHRITATYEAVPKGQRGGGIWTSPTVDPATNTIFVTTGTQNQPTQTMAQAMVGLDAGTLKVRGSWQLPPDQAGIDSDWGTTPVLFAGANGRPLVGAINKNGYFYAFDRANITPGPVWQRRVAIDGLCPPCGDGSVSSSAYANGTLFVAGGNTTINGAGYAGGVRALDPATGAVRWERGLAEAVIPAVTYVNGLVIVGAGRTLEVLDATNGGRLYSFATGAPIYGAPSVANGLIYVGSIDGAEYAFGLAPPIVPPPDAACPVVWTCQDIGGATPPGGEAVAGNQWTVTAGGAGIAGAADQFRLLSRPIAGDTQITAPVRTQQVVAAGAQTGLIARQSNAAGSPYYAVLATPNGGVTVRYRLAFGGPTTVAAAINQAALPRYLEIQRRGDEFVAASSADGTTYTLIGGTTATVIMPTSALIGVALASGRNGTAATSTLDAPVIGAVGAPPAPPPSASPCPNGWACTDVGNPALVGDQTLAGTNWTVKGAGTDIGGFADQFHFVSQPMNGDLTLSTRVSAQTNTNGTAKAGVMLRTGLGAGDQFYGAFVTPTAGIKVLYRDAAGLRAANLAATFGAAPAYIRVARWQTTFTAYTSQNGADWAPIAGSSVELGIGGQLLAGLAVTSHNAGAISTATMDAVALVANAPPPPTLCPAGWQCADIGFPTPPGQQTVAGGIWTIDAGGGDIWNRYDQFRYAWQPVTDDASVSLRITAQTSAEPDPWAKAGPMLRTTADPQSAYYFAFVTPGNGIVVQYRTAAGVDAKQALAVAGAPPAYLRVARAGNVYSTYRSNDGITWTYLKGSSVQLALPAAIIGGIAVTSHNTAVVSHVTADSLVITGAPPAPTTCPPPAGWTCADIGAPAVAGSQAFANGVWTMDAAGGDIWDTRDEFHYAWQTLGTDGSLTAQVTAQTNTSDWAKAGVMLRGSTDRSAPYYGAFITPGHGVSVQYRGALAGATAQVLTAGVVPRYLRITRTGTEFVTETSGDGAAWVVVPGSRINLNLPAQLLAGIAATSHNPGTLGHVTFANVGLAP